MCWAQSLWPVGMRLLCLTVLYALSDAQKTRAAVGWQLPDWFAGAYIKIQHSTSFSILALEVIC